MTKNTSRRVRDIYIHLIENGGWWKSNNMHGMITFAYVLYIYRQTDLSGCVNVLWRLFQVISNDARWERLKIVPASGKQKGICCWTNGIVNSKKYICQSQGHSTICRLEQWHWSLGFLWYISILVGQKYWLSRNCITGWPNTLDTLLYATLKQWCQQSVLPSVISVI